MKTRVSLTEAIELLKQHPEKPFVTVMHDETMSVEYFAPQKIDTQTPHQQDELYIIVRGHGSLVKEKETFEVKAGDVLFVKAGIEHRFENFSDDFATWVIFYGEKK